MEIKEAIANQLPDSTNAQHLKNLCLVSKTVRSAAQFALHRVAKPTSSINLLKLLRTVLERQDLTLKIHTLCFRAVRKNVRNLHRDADAVIDEVRRSSLVQLSKSGFPETHAWYRSIANGIESAFAGLLLVSLPALKHLDFWIQDRYLGSPSPTNEFTSALFGTMSIPEKIVNGFNKLASLRNIHSPIHSSDLSVFKWGFAGAFLTDIEVSTITIGTLCGLNGRGMGACKAQAMCPPFV